MGRRESALAMLVGKLLQVSVEVADRPRTDRGALLTFDVLGPVTHVNLAGLAEIGAEGVREARPHSLPIRLRHEPGQVVIDRHVRHQIPALRSITRKKLLLQITRSSASGGC